MTRTIKGTLLGVTLLLLLLDISFVSAGLEYASIGCTVTIVWYSICLAVLYDEDNVAKRGKNGEQRDNRRS